MTRFRLDRELEALNRRWTANKAKQARAEELVAEGTRLRTEAGQEAAELTSAFAVMGMRLAAFRDDIVALGPDARAQMEFEERLLEGSAPPDAPLELSDSVSASRSGGVVEPSPEISSSLSL